MASSVVALWSGCSSLARPFVGLGGAAVLDPTAFSFRPFILIFICKVKKLTSSGLEPLMTSLSGSKLGPLDYASQSSSEVGCVLKGAQLAVRSTNPRQYIHHSMPIACQEKNFLGVLG